MADHDLHGLKQLRFLIGRWQGHSEGFGQKSEVELVTNSFFKSNLSRAKQNPQRMLKMELSKKSMKI